MIHIEFNLIKIIIFLISSTLGSFILASVFTNFYKWKYYKKVYEDLPNKKFVIWKSVDGNTFSSEGEDMDTKFVRFRGNADWGYQLKHNIHLHRNFVTYLDPYSLYWLLKFDRYFKYNPVTDTEKKRNQRIDLLLK